MKKSLQLSVTVVILAIILTFDSCFTEQNDLASQKCDGPCVTITGRLTTTEGSAIVPLKYVDLEVNWYWTTDGASLAGTKRKKATGQSDVNGNYQLRFNVRSDELTDGHFGLQAFTPSDDFFFCSSTEDHPNIYLDGLNNDSTITQNIHVPHTASVKVNFSNVPDLTLNQGFWVEIRSQQTSCGQQVIYSKENPGTVTTTNVPSNQDLIVTTVINRGDGNGPERIKSDTLNIDRGQTENFTAVYPVN